MEKKEMDELLDDAINIRDQIEDELEAMEEMLNAMSDEINVNYADNKGSIENLKRYYAFGEGLNALREKAIKKLGELKGRVEPVWQETNPHKK